MELTALSSLIPTISSDKMADYLLWLKLVEKVIASLKEEMRKNYLIINMNLKKFIIEPKLLLKFDSLDVDSDRIAYLLDFYSTQECNNQVLEEAKEYIQGASDVSDYFNIKIKYLTLAGIARDNPQIIDLVRSGMNPDDRKKLGYLKETKIKDLENKIIMISQERIREGKQPQSNTILDDENLKLKKQVENLTIQLNNYVNYEGRGGSNRGRSRGRNNNSNRNNGNNNNRNNDNNSNRNNYNNQPRVCIKCNDNPPNLPYKYCQKCYDSFNNNRNNRSYNNNNNNNNDGNINNNIQPQEEYVQASLLHDGLVSQPEGIKLDLSKTTKYLSIECGVGSKNKKEVVMIDTGASISLVDTSVPYISEVNSNTNIRFGNGSTQVAKSRRLICIYVNNHVSFHIWAYVTTGLPTKVIIGTDFLHKRALIDMINNKIHLFSQSINVSDFHSAILLKIEGTDLLYEDYPFMRDLPLLPKYGEPDFRALLLKYIYKYEELSKRMKWVHNDSFEFPIDSDPLAIPVHHSPIIYNGPEREDVELVVKKWFELGVVRKSTSPWAHQIIRATQLKPVESGYKVESRVCPNLIPINSKTVPMDYPLPNPRDIVDRVTGRYKSKFDGSKGYLRFKLREEDKYKTAFIVQNIKGLGDKFEFNFMPWGAMNAGRFYQEKVENALRPTTIAGKLFSRNLKNECVEGFQDDIIVHTDSLRQHYDDVNETLERLYLLGLPINWKKVIICSEKISYCGYSITPEGITQDQTRVKALSKLRPPTNYSELDIFMGMANYHREFIKDYASKMKPLLDLQNIDRKKYRFIDVYKPTHRDNFYLFINLIQQQTLLSRPGEGEYHIFTDMSESNKTLSAQLLRVHEGKKYLISYASKRLSSTESSYSTPKLEMMAIWYGLTKFRKIIEGRKIKLFTDHRSLQGLHLKDPKKRWATWLTDIIEINPEVIHIAGKKNPVADAMTRLSEWANTMIVKRDETRKQIVKKYHHHFSDRKTVQNIRDKYDWDGIYKDVAECRESCEYCMKNRGTGETRNPMIPIYPERVWQIIGIDIKGPLTLNNNEKKQYGVAVDYFSKSTFIFPLSNYTSAEFWLKFEKNVLDNITTPEMIIGDRAKQFLSGESDKYKSKYQFSFQPSTACRHQANGEVENKIKFIDKLMHSFLSRGVSWRESIRQVTKIVNQEVINDSTLHTPYEIVYGHKYMSPFDIQVKQQIDHLSKVQKQVKKNIDISKEKQKYYYDQGKKINKFKENDWVMIYDNYKKGYLSDLRKGPYKIEKVLANDNYLIFNHNLYTWREFNVEKLKLYVPSLDAEKELIEEKSSVINQPLVQDKFEIQVEEMPQMQPQQEIIQPLDIPLQQDNIPPQDIIIDQPHLNPPVQSSRYPLRRITVLPGRSSDYRYRPDSYGPKK
jgi:hypothetical protein